MYLERRRYRLPLRYPPGAHGIRSRQRRCRLCPAHSNEEGISTVTQSTEKSMGRAPQSRGRGLTKTGRKLSSRVAKRRLGDRLKDDTASFNQGNLAETLRKQGYEEVPLDELQDRLSKLQGPLAAVILKGRV